MKFKIYTLGCKVNQYESQAIREFLISRGWAESENEPASLYIVNTCTVTHSADVKSKKYIRRAKRENPHAKVIAIGCLVESDAEALKKEKVDVLIPHSRKEDIFRLFDKEKDYPDIWSFKISDFPRARAFLKIQDGCDNACSFCKVRLVRGKSKSRPAFDIIEEVKVLIDKGFKEIVFCGTDLGSWTGEGGSFLVSLLEKVIEIPGLGRVRLSSIEPKYVNDELLNLMAGTDKICSHLHLPFQSGSDKVLKLMNKPAGSNLYYSLLDKIRKVIPDCGVSCDIMAGFPGEGDEDFSQTKKLLQRTEPVRAHVFSYSSRGGVLSNQIKEQLSPELIKKRSTEAISFSRQLSYKFRKQKEENIYKIVFDTGAYKGYKEGYTSNYIRVRVNDKNDKFDNGNGFGLAKVRISEVGYDLTVGQIT